MKPAPARIKRLSVTLVIATVAAIAMPASASAGFASSPMGFSSSPLGGVGVTTQVSEGMWPPMAADQDDNVMPRPGIPESFRTLAP